VNEVRDEPANVTPIGRKLEPDPLFEKLLAASQEANPVPKEGENTDQHYNYARAEDVIKEARRALHASGLVAVIDFTVESVKPITSSRGTGGMFCRVSAELRVFDPASGLGLAIKGAGAGIDYPGDKAPYKAMTGATKYVYASALGIPFGDDPEADAAQEAAPAQGQQTPPQQRQQRAQQARAGYRGEAQRDAFRAVLSDAGVPDVDVIDAAARAKLTAQQIDNAAAQLMNVDGRPAAIDALYKLAGTAPSITPPDTTDLPPAEPVEGEVVEPATGEPAADVFNESPTESDPEL
jgi:hypothetical protein